MRGLVDRDSILSREINARDFLRKEIVRLEIYLYISLSKFDRIEIMKE